MTLIRVYVEDIVRTTNGISETTRFHYSNDKNFKHRETNLKEICQRVRKKTYFSLKKVSSCK